MQFRLECEHALLHNRNCIDCGLYVHPQMKITGLKTQKYRAVYPGSKHLSYLRKLSEKFEKSIPQYCIIEDVRRTLDSLVQVLNLNRETYAQSLYIYQIASYEMVKKKCYDPKYAVLYASACLVLASKMVYPERSVPPMQGIKRILNCNYGKRQFCKAQRLILKMLNYEVPNFTFLDFLNYYLMCGGIFSNQNFRDPLKFQYKLDGIVWSYIKNATFLQYDQQSLAAYILYKVRNDIKVSQVWNWHIQFFTQINGNKLKEILESMQISPRESPKIQIMQLSSYPRILTISNTPRQKVKVYDKVSVQQSIQFIKRGYSNIKRQRSNSQSNCNRLQSVRTGSSLNKFAFRVE